ncbi:EamA family transporter [Cupriavidus basilensis]
MERLYVAAAQTAPRVAAARPVCSRRSLTGLVVSVPVTAWELMTLDQPLQWSGKVAAILLYVATIPSLLAYFAWDRAIARAGAQLPVFFITLTPVFAALLSTLLLGDWPRWYHAVGLVAIGGWPSGWRSGAKLACTAADAQSCRRRKLNPQPIPVSQCDGRQPWMAIRSLYIRSRTAAITASSSLTGCSTSCAR